MPAKDESKQRLLGADHRDRHDRNVTRARGEEADAGFAPDERTALAPVPLREEPEDLAAREHAKRGHQRTAITLTPPDRERTGGTHEISEQRNVEGLDLGHVAHRQIERDRDERWVLPVDVIRHEDVRAVTWKVLPVLDANMHQGEDDRADRREQEAPQEETLDR